MLNCRQATQLLSEKQDRPLLIGEKLSLSLHTGMCPSCRRFGQQMATLSELSKQYRQYNILDQPTHPNSDSIHPSKDPD